MVECDTKVGNARRNVKLCFLHFSRFSNILNTHLRARIPRFVICSSGAKVYITPMQPLKHTIKAVISKGESHYVAECLEVSVVTQGKTLDDVVKNLREAVALHLDNENLAELGFVPNPALVITMEVEPAHAA